MTEKDTFKEDLQALHDMFRQVIKRNEILSKENARMKAALQRIVRIYKENQEAYVIAQDGLENV
jgi:hypothetical protein